MTGSGKHLALFIRSLGGGGGAERMMVTLAGAFASRGHRVDLVLGRVEGNFVGDVPDSVRLVDLGGRSVITALPALLRDPWSAWPLLPALVNLNPPWVLGCIPALERYLREERPDAMLSALNYTNITALWSHHLAGVPTRLVVSERNTLSVRAGREVRRRLRALPRLVRRFYPWADGVVAVSAGVAEDLAQVTGIPRSEIRTTYNPVVGPEIAVQAAAPLDHPWFASGEPPVLLAAGKLKPQKGFTTLLEAFALLRRRRPARLIVLGEGPQRRELEARVHALGIENDVALPGFVANPFAYMARSAVFVLSSAWEGLPGVLIQAMACGCPVVATQCPSGPAEILEKGEHGPLVPVGDAPALSTAIESVLEAPPDSDQLRGRAGAFSVESSVDRYLESLVG
jgi:glycosyltransferase involved in cell wall biosynthesis